MNSAALPLDIMTLIVDKATADRAIMVINSLARSCRRMSEQIRERALDIATACTEILYGYVPIMSSVSELPNGVRHGILALEENSSESGNTLLLVKYVLGQPTDWTLRHTSRDGSNTYPSQTTYGRVNSPVILHGDLDAINTRYYIKANYDTATCGFHSGTNESFFKSKTDNAKWSKCTGPRGWMVDGEFHFDVLETWFAANAKHFGVSSTFSSMRCIDALTYDWTDTIMRHEPALMFLVEPDDGTD